MSTRTTRFLACTLTLFFSQTLPSPAGTTEGLNRYSKKVLVANRADLAEGGLVDPHMINPWGIALRPPGAGGHFWISNAGNASTSTFVGDAKGKPLTQDGLKIVFLDGPLLSYEDGIANVTGQVYNAASDFEGQPVEFPVSGPATNLAKEKPEPLGVISGAAKFVFVTTDGTVNAWRSGTAASMDRAVIVKDYSDHGKDQIKTLPQLSAFTGVAMTTLKGPVNRLYITDFQNGIIRVLDNAWNDITNTVHFDTPANLPPHWNPYNIQYLQGLLYVAYAELDVGADEAAADKPGAGVGHIAVFDYDGHLIREFQDKGHLNSPWGFAIAPKDFGPLSGALLVANFGDGTVAGFDLRTGAFRDVLRDEKGQPLVLDGVWGLAFGNGVGLGDTDSLYYTAGPNGEQDGIFGRVRWTGRAPVAADAQKINPASVADK